MEREMWRPGNMLYPLPAVMVSCQRAGEKPNIITVAWAGTVCSSPAMVSISIRPNRYSYQIIKETGEFVINLTTEKLAYATDYCGVRSGKDVDKFKEMNLTPLPSKFVDAPGIEESPVNIECKVKQIVELGSHHMFIADVLGVNVDKTLINKDQKLELSRSMPMVYSHGGRVRVRKQLGRVAQLFRRDKRCRRVNTGENIELAITRTILEKNFRQDIGTRCMVIAIIFAAKERHARAIFLSDLRDLLIVGRYHHFVEKPALERRLDRICDDGLTAKLFDVLARYALRTAASRDNGDATHSETPPRHTIEPHPRDSL